MRDLQFGELLTCPSTRFGVTVGGVARYVEAEYAEDALDQIDQTDLLLTYLRALMVRRRALLRARKRAVVGVCSAVHQRLEWWVGLGREIPPAAPGPTREAILAKFCGQPQFSDRNCLRRLEGRNANAIPREPRLL
jgi:hypothetical protein